MAPAATGPYTRKSDLRPSGIQTCGTCGNAQKTLRAKGIVAEVMNLRSDGLAPSEMRRLGKALLTSRVNRWLPLPVADRRCAVSGMGKRRAKLPPWLGACRRLCQ